MTDETPTTSPVLSSSQVFSSVPATGFKTTEFWQGIASLALGAFLVVYGAITPDKADLVDLGCIVMLGQSLGYGAMRTITKVKGV